MKNKLKLLMQSWSFRSVGHWKFGPRAHVNHQQENVKDNLDVTLVCGERDLEATKIVMSVSFCLFVTLKEEFGGSLPLYSSPTRVEAAR